MTGQHVSTKRGFYTDPEIRPWKPLTKFLYRYLYENDHAHGITGMGKIDRATMAFETGMTLHQVDVAIAEMGDKVMWFSDGTYWVRGRAKHTCYTGKRKLHPKFAAGAQNYLKEQSDEVIAAFAERYPELIGDVSAMHHQSIGEPVKTTLPTVTVAGTVAVTGTVTDKEPPPPSPSEAGTQSPSPSPTVPKVVGVFLAGKHEGVRRRFYENLTTALTVGAVGDVHPVEAVGKALAELAEVIDDQGDQIKSPNRYFTPILKRHIKVWREQEQTRQMTARTVERWKREEEERRQRHDAEEVSPREPDDA